MEYLHDTLVAEEVSPKNRNKAFGLTRRSYRLTEPQATEVIESPIVPLQGLSTSFVHTEDPILF